MHKIRKFKVRQVKMSSLRNMLVLSLASFVLAIPMLSLPLGLNNFMSVQAATVSNTSALVASAKSGSDANLFVPGTDTADFIDASLNRSQNELAADTQAVQADPAQAPVDPAQAAQADPAEAAAVDPAEAAAPLQLAADEQVFQAMDQASAEPVLTEVDYDVYIKADVLNVRSEANADSEIVAKITIGDRVHAVAEFGDWLQIEADDQIGFIKTEFTSTGMVFRPVSETLYVKGTSLNVRDSYSTDGTVLANLDAGHKVKRTGIGDEWSQIELADGQVGYVASKYLTKVSGRTTTAANTSDTSGGSVSSSADAPDNTSGNTIVDLAYKAIGTRYVYGSESLKGMDCSGLVNWAYNQVGISVPRSSSSFGSAGEGVSLDNAQPGDVLCIDARPRDGKSRITHVAIYIGNGQVIHASTSQHSVVKASLDSFYNVGYKILSVRRFPN